MFAVEKFERIFGLDSSCSLSAFDFQLSVLESIRFHSKAASARLQNPRAEPIGFNWIGSLVGRNKTHSRFGHGKLFARLDRPKVSAGQTQDTR